MIKCKIFGTSTEYYNDGTRIRSPEDNFNKWSAETNYKINSMYSHSDMNGVVKSIVVFYEELKDEDILKQNERVYI